MHHDSLVAINISCDGSLLNNRYPILFYWNGLNDPIDDIIADDSIVKLIYDSISTLHQYDNTTIDYATYKFDGQDDIYEEKTAYAKDFFSYGGLNESLSEEVLLSILKEAYAKVIGQEFEPEWEEPFNSQVSSIVNAIREKHSKLSKETIVNYVRNSFKALPNRYTNDKIKERNEEAIVSLAEATII